jgi:hypothetical protein
VQLLSLLLSFDHICVSVFEFTCLGACISFAAFQLEPTLAVEKVLISETVEVVVESEHPYLNDTNKMYTIEIPGASSITLRFDPASKTEDNYDYVTLYKDATKSAWIGPKEKFCGTSFGTDSFEVAQDKVSCVRKVGSSGHFRVQTVLCPQHSLTSVVAAANAQVFVWFHSDGSNNDWGFRLFASGSSVVDKTPPPQPPAVLSIILSQIRHRVLKAVLSLASHGGLAAVPLPLLSTTMDAAVEVANAPVTLELSAGGVR